MNLQMMEQEPYTLLTLREVLPIVPTTCTTVMEVQYSLMGLCIPKLFAM